MADTGGEAAPSKRGGIQLFPYHRQLAPMLWAFAAILIVEMGLVQLLLAHWIGPLALVLGLISGVSLVALIALIASFRRRPVALTDGSLRVRTGFLVDTDVPLGEIAFAQSGYTPADYMPGSLLKASLLTHPNVVVLLRRDIDLPGPFGRTRNVHALALALDEPARFLLALNVAVKGADVPGESLAAA